MRAIELFAGVGGFRLGLERNGIEVIWANEWDKHAADTYDKNFGTNGGGINRESITDVPATDIPIHQLICGGFPCQSFSVAGKRRGFEETRGTLFFEIMRIAQHHRTPYLLLENVKGLLSHDEGRTFATIITAMDELGYDCQWQVLNSKDFGVPQNRERIFIIANLRTEPRPQIFPITGQQSHAGAGNNQGTHRIADTITTRYGARNSRGTHIKQVGSIYGGQSGRVYSPEGLAPTLSTMTGGGNKQPKIVERTPLRFLDRNQKNIEGDYAFTVDTSNTGGVKIDGQVRRLTPLECERLQGFPDAWTEGQSDTQRYKQMGNAVTVNVVEAIARQLLVPVPA